MSMKKSTGFVLLLCVIAVMFVVSCVRKTEVIPEMPANLRVTALAGVVGVELRWDAVAGAASYDVTLTRPDASGSRQTFGPYNTTKPYYLVSRDDVGAGNFNWSVIAKNYGEQGSDPKAGTPFTLEPEPDPVYGLVLTLVETPDLSSAREENPEIHVLEISDSSGISSRAPNGISYFNLNFLTGTISYEQVSDVPRQNMSIQLMVEKIGSGLAKRWPDSSTEFLLDEEGELVFGVNDLGENYDPEKLAPGDYNLWARAAWDVSVQSTKKPFKIVASEESVEVTIDVYNQDTKYPDKVCGIYSEVELDYDVKIEPSPLFDELYYSFVIAQLGTDGIGEASTSSTFTAATQYATTVTYATECTKFATVTVDGTLTRFFWDNITKQASEETLGIEEIVVKGHSFVLDMANPTALVSLELPAGFTPTIPASLTNATLTFLASDTKCLRPYAEKIAFEVYVEKGISSWFETFAFFEEDVILGDNSIWGNEITIDATYLATKTSSTNPDEAQTLLLFDIPIMDYATITATMSVHDCCCDNCTIEPGKCDDPDDVLSHATEVSTQFVVDNVFFSSLLEELYGEDELFLFEVPEGEAEDHLIPASPTQATLTVRFTDALWSETQWENIDWSFYDADGSPFSSIFVPTIDATELITGVCSGYATKTQVVFVGTLTADPTEDDTETSLTLVATAVDATGNEFVIELPFLYDTLPPTLTHFTAFRDQYNNHSWVEFRFDQKPESAELSIVANGQPFDYDLEDATLIEGIPNAYRLLTGITLPYNAEVTLNATATDLAGNIGFSSKTSTVSLSEKR